MLASIGKQNLWGTELDGAVEAASTAFVDCKWSEDMIKRQLVDDNQLMTIGWSGGGGRKEERIPH